MTKEERILFEKLQRRFEEAGQFLPKSWEDPARHEVSIRDTVLMFMGHGGDPLVLNHDIQQFWEEGDKYALMKTLMSGGWLPIRKAISARMVGRFCSTSEADEVAAEVCQKISEEFRRFAETLHFFASRY